MTGCSSKHCPNRALEEFGLVSCSECTTIGAWMIVGRNMVKRIEALEAIVGALLGRRQDASVEEVSAP